MRLLFHATLVAAEKLVELGVNCALPIAGLVRVVNYDQHLFFSRVN